MPHPSVDSTIAALQERSPNAPFLALGQTVFWDEPVKAVWRRILDVSWPSAQLVAGIHDTDYFAKTTAHVADNEEFVALEHDDGATRGLWSAAAELSVLLGSEDLPSRSFFESVGIPFDRLAGRNSAERRKFFADYTSAYGWRGVVQTAGAPQIAHDILLNRFAPALIDLLQWGFDTSIKTLDTGTAARGAEATSKIRGWVQDFLGSCGPHATLPDLYRNLLPLFYKMLLDFEPANFSVTSTAQLLKFDATTAHLPRFSFVQLFLNPATRSQAVDAYSRAVAGGGMYPLDHFGKDALPFDLVVPRVGRGTLHLADHELTVDFATEPVSVPLHHPITDLQSLAAVLAEAFGAQVILVGKAVSLISMLSAEYVLIFHETASGYTDRTAAMNQYLRSSGIDLPLNPILRLQYNTWDSLKGVPDTAFSLPAHLESSFRSSGASVSAAEFARLWKQIVLDQKAAIQALAMARSTRAMLSLLSASGDSQWIERLRDLERHLSALQKDYADLENYRATANGLKLEIVAAQQERARLEAESGADYRSRLAPLKMQAPLSDSADSADISNVERERMVRFTIPIREIALKLRRMAKELKEVRAGLRRAERSDRNAATRYAIAEMQASANMAKLVLARHAYLTVHGLPHTNCRPTAWWLPMVDPTGTWFDNIADTVEARLEEV